MRGTIDHLHIDNKFLIKTVLSLSHKIFIGLTIRKMLQIKNFSSKIEDYAIRKKNLENFINNTKDLDRVKIIKLDNPFGPSIDDHEYKGIVVSQETYKEAL